MASCIVWICGLKFDPSFTVTEQEITGLDTPHALPNAAKQFLFFTHNFKLLKLLLARKVFKIIKKKNHQSKMHKLNCIIRILEEKV